MISVLSGLSLSAAIASLTAFGGYIKETVNAIRYWECKPEWLITAAISITTFMLARQTLYDFIYFMGGSYETPDVKRIPTYLMVIALSDLLVLAKSVGRYGKDVRWLLLVVNLLTFLGGYLVLQ